MSSEHPSMPTVLPRVAATLALIALGGVAGILLDGVVAGSSTVVTGFVAATLAAVVATIVMLPGRSLHPAIAAAVVGGSAIVVAIGVAATEPARSPQRSPIAAALDAMANGWAAILRSPVPADAEPRILVPLALLVFSATATAITLERRTASSAAALLAPLAAIVLTAVAAGGRQDHPLLTGLGILVAIGVFLFARSTVSLAVPTLGATHRTTDYQWAMAASLAIVAVVGATLVGPQLALDRDPFDPRDHVEAPVAPAAATSPLDLVSSRHRQNDTVMFSVDSDVPLITRLAAFEAFDGVQWSLAGPFERSGRVLPTTQEPAGDQRATPARPITAEITIDGLTGPWLPVFGRPRSIDGVPVLLEPTSGSLVAESGDVSGATYAVEAVVAEPDLVSLQTTPIADAASVASTSIPTSVPDALRRMAMVATGGATTPLTNAVLLELYLRSNFAVDDTGAGGYTVGHLTQSLTVSGVGTPGQFAASFALLGRIVGLPTRVVVGFAPGVETGPGRYDVTGDDTRVWPEVHFEGAGWVPFDPVPAAPGSAATGGTISVGLGPGGEVIVESDGDDRPEDVGGDVEPGSGAVEADSSDDGGSTWPTVAVMAAAILLMLAVVLPLAVMWLKRRRTRQRRSETDPRLLVIGAWHDVLDRFMEQRVERPTLRTVGDLVTETESTSTALAGLYRPVNRALYGDAESTTDEGEQAWRARDRYVNALDAQDSVFARARRHADPRPLFAPADHRDDDDRTDDDRPHDRVPVGAGREVT